MGRKRLWVVLCMIIALTCTSCGQAEKEETEQNESSYAGMNIEKTANYFEEVQAIFDEDNGAMWGQKLENRLMIVNESTNEFIANCQSANNLLQQNGEVYVGVLPKEQLVSCSTVEYDGQLWATVLSNYPQNDDDMVLTCVHELFHMNQPLLGLVEPGYNNSQMDEMDARVDLKLEWNALEKALQTQGEERKNHIKAALTFRNDRRAKYNCTDSENCFEIMEGLAEQTSEELVYGKERLEQIKIPAYRSRMFDDQQTPTFVRSFGYYSGLLYGTLLEDYNPNWREMKYNKITANSNLGDLLGKEAGVGSNEETVESIRDNYNYASIMKIEESRKEKFDMQNELLSKQLVDGTILQVEFTGNMSFDPGQTWAFKEYGTVYYGFSTNANWGMFSSDTAPVLLDSNYTVLTVNAENVSQDDNVIKGRGWQIELADGYSLQQNSKGNYEIKKN